MRLRASTARSQVGPGTLHPPPTSQACCSQRASHEGSKPSAQQTPPHTHVRCPHRANLPPAAPPRPLPCCRPMLSSAASCSVHTATTCRWRTLTPSSQSSSSPASAAVGVGVWRGGPAAYIAPTGVHGTPLAGVQHGVCRLHTPRSPKRRPLQLSPQTARVIHTAAGTSFATTPPPLSLAHTHAHTHTHTHAPVQAARAIMPAAVQVERHRAATKPTCVHPCMPGAGKARQ